MQSKGLAHKCIEKDGKVVRHHNAVADVLVRDDGWKFVPRSRWKTEVRDA